jgi:multicomponent Na+:H+ antiporter subunit D
MIAAHLPALQVVVPLFSATICALFRRGPIAWAVTLAVSWAMAVVSTLLLWRVLAEGTISYHLGSWPPPWGIEYRVDVANAFVLLLVTFVNAVIIPYARRSVAAEIPEDRVGWFYAAYLLSFAGLLGIAITGDAFNIFVFLEISSLSSYILIAMGRDRRALVAAFQYLIMGTIGATFIVVGVGLLYLMTGTLNLVDIAARLPAVQSTRPVIAALAFLTVGICLKLALFPLHLWLPNAYAFAPSVATAFLAATATKVAIYLLLRFFFSIFGASLVFDALPLREIFIGLSLAAIAASSVVAMFQHDVKRMLAYSSLAQIGFITLGIGMLSETGLTGAIVHLFNHGVMKGALFLLVGGVAFRLGGVQIGDFAGLGRRMPLTAFAITVAAISMVGGPGTVGFISKWYLALGAFELGWWWLVAAILGGSLLTLVYAWRLVEAMYLRPAPEGALQVEAPPSLLAPSLVLVVACVYFGFDTTLTAEIAARAASTLLEGVR